MKFWLAYYWHLQKSLFFYALLFPVFLALLLIAPSDEPRIHHIAFLLLFTEMFLSDALRRYTQIPNLTLLPNANHATAQYLSYLRALIYTGLITVLFLKAPQYLGLTALILLVHTLWLRLILATHLIKHDGAAALFTLLGLSAYDFFYTLPMLPQTVAYLCLPAVFILIFTTRINTLATKKDETLRTFGGNLINSSKQKPTPRPLPFYSSHFLGSYFFYYPNSGFIVAYAALAWLTLLYVTVFHPHISVHPFVIAEGWLGLSLVCASVPLFKNKDAAKPNFSTLALSPKTGYGRKGFTLNLLYSSLKLQSACCLCGLPLLYFALNQTPAAITQLILSMGIFTLLLWAYTWWLYSLGQRYSWLHLSLFILALGANILYVIASHYGLAAVTALNITGSLIAFYCFKYAVKNLLTMDWT